MAVYWNLALVTRTREEAEACVGFFERQRLVIDQVEVPLEISRNERPDGWLVGVWPRGMMLGSPASHDARLTVDHARARIAEIFDAWLLEAPPFAAAIFGGEAFDYFLDGRVEEVLAGGGVEGLVVSESTWIALGRPTEARSVQAGRFAWPRSRIP